MGKLIDKATGKEWDVPDDEMEGAMASGLYDVPTGETATVTEGDITYSVPAEDLTYHTERGAVAETPEEEFARQERNRMEREHGGFVEGAKTFVQSAAGAATGGGTDVLGRIFGPEDYAKDLRERREVHGGLATAGDIAGYVLPALATGGTSVGAKALAKTPAGMVSKLGSGGGIRGLAAEGAATGVLQTGHELALSEEPFDMERAASQLATNVALGGASGGALGVFAKAAGKGAQKAKALADDFSAKLAKRSSVSDDLASLDMPGLKAAKEAEQLATGARLADEVTNYHAASDALDPILLAEGDVANSLIAARRSRKALLKNQKALKRRPGDALKHLEKEEQALREVLSSSDDLLAKFDAEDLAILKKLGKKTEPTLLKGRAARKFSEHSGRKITKEGVEIGVDELAGFKNALASGELRGARARTLEGLPDLIESNAKAQEGLVGLMKGTTPEIKAIDNAIDVMRSGGRQKGFIEAAANTALTGVGIGAASPMLGFTAGGAVAKNVADKITDLVFGRAAKAGANAGLRTSAALDKLLTAGAKTGKLAPPLATKVLAATSFAPVADRAPLPKATLISSYKRVSDEIRGQVTMGPKGITMRPEARSAVADRLSGVRMASPKLADYIETVTNRKMAFLAKKLPKRPDFMQSAVGPDTFQPSNMQLRTFARFVAAVEDPAAVEERLADGSLSPEDAEAYREVYPEMYAAMQRDIVERLPELRETLPYAKRLSLSIFSGVAVDPALDPRIFRQLQSQHTDEPGSEGGTQAPVPQPQFGSVKVPQPTDAQERAG